MSFNIVIPILWNILLEVVFMETTSRTRGLNPNILSTIRWQLIGTSTKDSGLDHGYHGVVMVFKNAMEAMKVMAPFPKLKRPLRPFWKPPLIRGSIGCCCAPGAPWPWWPWPTIAKRKRMLIQPRKMWKPMTFQGTYSWFIFIHDKLRRITWLSLRGK